MVSERIQKYLARCGVGSRRACEDLVQQGRVTVDGEIIREPGFKIDPDTQTVCYNGREVRPEKNVYYALHKPPGHVCTSHDPQGRPLAISLLPPNAGRIYTVGRLDADSEGLIIVTNDGDFAHRLSHPRYEIHKSYEISLSQPLSGEQMQAWRKGIIIEDTCYRVLSIRHLKTGKSGAVYEAVLGEGKNRHLRRMVEASGLTVYGLKRTAIGSLKLGSLKRGAYRELTVFERERLLASGASGKPV